MTATPPEPAPSAQELADVVSSLSERATGSTWDAQASTAVWYLATYGGEWDRLAAHDAGADLDRAQLIASALDLWPVPSESEPDADGLPSQEIAFESHREFAAQRRLVEQGGVVAVAHVLHLLRDGSDTPGRLVCGAVAPDGPLRRVAAPRRSGEAWCVTCAQELTADVGRAIGWTVRPA